MTVATPTITQDQISTLVDQGVSLDDIESEVIEPAAELSDEERSALWLFAWSRQRRTRELRRLSRRREPAVPGC
jgi:hypothetical protein